MCKDMKLLDLWDLCNDYYRVGLEGFLLLILAAPKNQLLLSNLIQSGKSCLHLKVQENHRLKPNENAVHAYKNIVSGV